MLWGCFGELNTLEPAAILTVASAGIFQMAISELCTFSASLALFRYTPAAVGSGDAQQPLY